MRDPERIDKILSLLEERWKSQPDLRLGQILINLMRQKKKNLIAPEVFYFEDSKLLEILECLMKTSKE